MGVKNISKVLKKYGKSIDLLDLKDKTIAVDTSIYLYKFKYNTKNNDFIKKFIYQIYSYKKQNITPIYVFDCVKQEHKQETINKRKKIMEKNQKAFDEEQDPEEKKKLEKNIIKITKEDVTNLKTLLDICKIEYINSSTEAEKHCSFLNKTKKVDYVLSNDYDSLTFGCEKLITSDFTHGYTEYCLKEMLEDKKISLKDYVEVCIACGTDYFPSGIPNIGPVKAFNNVKKYGNIENWKKIEIPEDIKLDTMRSIFLEDTCQEIEKDKIYDVLPELQDFVKQLSIIINPKTLEKIL